MNIKNEFGNEYTACDMRYDLMEWVDKVIETKYSNPNITEYSVTHIDYEQMLLDLLAILDRGFDTDFFKEV